MTKEYDIALAKFHQKSKIIPIPLISWDLFSLQQMEFTHFSSIQKQWKAKVNYFTENEVMIVTNTNFEIVFASKNIFQMNGYHSKEVIGKTPKMFQGRLTSRNTLYKIKVATSKQLSFNEVITNYKKDGSIYECEIKGVPKFNSKGILINYIAFERIAS